jgi:hypothetical protein
VRALNCGSADNPPRLALAMIVVSAMAGGYCPATGKGKQTMQTDIHWEFKTDRFRVVFESMPEYDLDLSWDDTGQVEADIVCGHLIAFVARVAVYLDGECVGEDYLGQCIYETPEDFMDHRGMNKKGHGSYFSDMVSIAIANAREYIKNKKPIYVRVAA